MSTNYGGFIKLQLVLFNSRVAVLVGFFVLLSGFQLRGQDQLLKEYIYLDGRLLAVERQSMPAAAQQPAIHEDKDLKANAAADWPADNIASFLPVNTHELSLSHSRGSLASSVALQQCLGAPASSPACVSD